MTSPVVPGYAILPVTEADLPTLSLHLRLSKLPLTINRLLFKDWPNEAAQSVQYSAAIEASFRDGAAEMVKVVHEASGHVVGHLVLTHKQPDDGAQPTVAPNGMVPELYYMILNGVSKLEEVIRSREHLELTHIYVTPGSRKRGIGSALIRLAMQKAETKRIPLFAGSEPDAHQLFLKLGLKEVGHVDFELSNYAPQNSGFGRFRLSGMIHEVQQDV